MARDLRTDALTVIDAHPLISWPDIVDRMTGRGWDPRQTATIVDDLEGTRVITITGAGIQRR